MKNVNFRLLSLALLVCVLSASCKQKTDWNEEETSAGSFQTNQAVKIYEAIDEMGTKAWEKSIYTDLSGKIDFYTNKGKIIEVDSEKLHKYLDKVYCDILIRDAFEILNNKSCETKHSLLKSFYTEISEMYKIANKELLNPVKTKIELHNRIIGYSIGDVTVNSADEKYDLSFIDNVFKQKSDFEKENFPCEGVKRKLNNIPSELNRRHVNFINELINNYAEQQQYDQSLDNHIRHQIENYYYTDNTGKYSRYGISSGSALQLYNGWVNALKEIQNNSENK